MKKIYSFLAAALVSVSVMAAVGPQSIDVRFNGLDAEGWVASSGGSITSVANGVANVQMAVQSSGKYRADFQYNTAGDFSFDKAKDIVWAIKLTGALPGAANSRKFEIQYVNDGDKWINGISGPSGSLDCTDGGKIYYFDLAALNKLADVQDGEVAIRQIHFIFADATELTDETAKYAVDWVASFASVDDLRAFQDWDDEQTDATLPYYEVLYRTQNGTSFNSGFPKNGFTSVEFEGNYRAGIFAVEYFLVENFDASKSYELKLTNSQAANKDSLAVWDFPYQTTTKTTAADIYAKATEVVGFAPGDSAACKAPIAEAKVDNSVWTLTVPGAKLTALATVNTKTLVGLFITNKQCATKDKKAKFATASHETADAPSFTVVEEGPATAIDQTTSDQRQTTNKVIRNGQVLIIRDGVEFNILGQIVK